jgi:membrane-associated phospholipid phosphatase
VIVPRVHSDVVGIAAGRTTDVVRTAGVVGGARPRTLLGLIGAVVTAFLLVEALLLGLGLLVTRVLAHGWVHREEVAFERSVLTHRTPWWNHVTSLGTVLGATNTVIALTAVGCLVLALRGHGPRLPAFLAVAVAGETTLFVLASIVVHRLRPTIPHLDGAPPTSSFPSGHTAATVALWCGLALGLARTHPAHPLRVVSWVLAVVLPAFVLFSRLYRGMHWPTDVAASVVFTLLWLLVLRAVLLPRGVPDRAVMAPASPGGD